MQPEIPAAPAWVPALPASPDRPVYTLADSLYALCCILLGYMGVRWLFFGGYGFGTTAMLLLFCLAVGLYRRGTGAALPLTRWLWLGLIVLFSLSFSLYAQGPVSFVCALFLWLLGTLWVSRAEDAGPLLRGSWPADACRALCVLPFTAYSGLFGSLRRLLAKIPTKKPLRGVLLGLLLAVPVTLLVGALLMQADAAFSSLLDTVARVGVGEAVRQVFLSVLYLLLGIPAAAALFSLAFSSRHHLKKGVCGPAGWERVAREARFAPRSVLYAALTPVCILYALFFTAQSAYFLSAFQNLLPDGFAYADYARRGFFELCAVAVINLILVACLQAFCKRQEGATRPPAGVRVYTMLLSVCTLLLIATALRKMLLYIDRYGLTPLRVYTSWFMLLLAGVFLLLMLKQFFVRLPFVRTVGMLTALLLGILCFGGVNGQIARHNVEQYQNGELEQMDVALLSRLGTDAVPALVRLAEDDTEAGREARLSLRNERDALDNVPFAQRSLSYYRAKKLLHSPAVEALLSTAEVYAEEPVFPSFPEEPYDADWRL